MKDQTNFYNLLILVLLHKVVFGRGERNKKDNQKRRIKETKKTFMNPEMTIPPSSRC